MPVTLNNTVLRGTSLSTFSPAQLFNSGEQGVWYDPSDMSTMFTDVNAKTQVTAAEQTVAIMLDKSKNFALGAELVTNGTFNTDTTGWTTALSATIDVVNGELRLIGNGLNNGGGANDFPYAYQDVAVTAGKVYRLTCNARSATAGKQVTLTPASGTDITTASTTTVTLTTLYRPTTSTLRVAVGGYYNAASYCYFDNISLREVLGNHATQSTAGSRPTLSARYNRFIKTEQFDDATWTKTNLLAFGSGSTVNATTAPDGTTTADLITSAASTAVTTVDQYYNNTVASTSTFSICVKSNGANYVQLLWNSALSSNYANFDLTNGTVTGGTYTAASAIPLGNGWYRCSITSSLAVTNNRVYLAMIPAANSTRVAAFTGDGVSGVYVWGADVRSSNDGVGLPNYQRVNTSTDYDTTNFPYYLSFNGTSSTMATGSIDFTGSDKVTLWSGIRKLSDSTVGIVAELSSDSFTTSGAWYLAAPLTTGASSDFAWWSRGSVQTTPPALTSALPAPTTKVVSGIAEISSDTRIIRVNGLQSGSASGDQGAGNFVNQPLYIGARAGNTLYFSGRLYGLIVRGAASGSGEVSNTESWLNAKTRAY